MNNLRLAFRNLWRKAFYAWINVLGLSVSMAAVIFILFWVKDELSYDGFHKDAGNIYMGLAQLNSGGEKMYMEQSTGLFAPTVGELFPEVTTYCRVKDLNAAFIKYEGKRIHNVKYLVSDSTFFSFFSFPIVKGEQGKLLQNPSGIVISERLAYRLFGDEDPIGKTIEVEGVDIKREAMVKPMQVTAVMRNLPHNTMVPHDVDIVCPLSSNINELYSMIAETWYSIEFYTFLRIQSGADVNAIAEKMTNEIQPSEHASYRSFTIQPLSKMHLYTAKGEPGGIKKVRIFFFIAIAILLIGCINYVNMVTARAIKRTKEVGIRKVMGGKRVQIFWQLVVEAAVLFIIAMLFALIAVCLLTPSYTQLTGKPLSLLNADMWLVLGGVLVAVMALAGVYPTLMLSSYNPLVVMKGGSHGKGRNTIFRKILITLQFSCSIILITGTIVLDLQMKLLREKDLGYNKEHVFTFPIRNLPLSTVKAELAKSSAVIGVTAARANIMDVESKTSVSKWEGSTTDQEVMVAQLAVDTSFFRVMGLPLLSGGGFSPHTTEDEEIILNEKAIAVMGLTDPINKRVYLAGYPARIVGVVPDFHFQTLDKQIDPFVLYPTAYPREIYVHTTAEKVAQAIEEVNKLWQQYNSDYEFSYQFMDEKFESMLRSDIQSSILFNVFAVVAIFVSCLGLFGLATYTAETRTKEIGIRKTLGASVSSIVSMLSKEFVVLVGVAVAAGIPIAYYFMEKMLQSYAYRISIAWWMILTAILVVLALVILTVSAQALRAARTNPVKAIKTE